MDRISVFDMLKIGIGPSSSHTLGPWRAAQRFLDELKSNNVFDLVQRVQVQLYGSLALTGKGHGTDVAILLGLSGEDPVTVALEKVQTIPAAIAENAEIILSGHKSIKFDCNADIAMHMDQALPLHANGMGFTACDNDGKSLFEAVYYSVGGGFIVDEDGQSQTAETKQLSFPTNNAEDIKQHCAEQTCTISQLVMKNEIAWRTEDQIQGELLNIWITMKECIFRGCHTDGTLPGGLNVTRRAPNIYRSLMAEAKPTSSDSWISHLQQQKLQFTQIIKWIGCFAIAVNEENASFGRIVTAPTNGAAGVIPAVLLYYICFTDKPVNDEDIVKFLLVAGEIGSIFKKGATISAAMGGCQAEIGVSSAMAAAALTEAMGGDPDQALMAAEIAMEHHLGLTCDPVGGLVQIPCIERNSMGAVKAITASNIALESNPDHAKVSLDDVIKTMWETAQDMNSKYKETSLGGLAVRVSVGAAEC